jgi:hypothetical protein
MKTWALADNYIPKLRPGLALHPWQTLAVVFLHHCRNIRTFALLADEPGIGKVILKKVLDTN